MSKNFTKADLENIDFQASYKDNKGFAYMDNIVGGFKVFLKDGRKFYCCQDLDCIFTIHNDKYGDAKGNLLVKIAADLIADNDMFAVMFYSIGFISEFVLENYFSSYKQTPRFDTVLQDTCFAIIKEYAHSSEDLVISLLKMGLDENNKAVTIEPIDEQNQISA